MVATTFSGATVLEGVYYSDNVSAVIVDSCGFWVTDCIRWHEVVAETGGPVARVYSRDGRATECSCRGRECRHRRATNAVLANW